MELRLNVLIADDSEDDALLLIRELRKGGIECVYHRVEDASAMKHSLELQRWDLIVTDHNMPSFSSSEALQIAKAAQPDTPVLVVSGEISDDLAVHSMKSGAQDYIMKDNLARLVPVVERELREVAQRVARKHAEAQAAYLEHHDKLTDLINRDVFKKQLTLMLDQSRIHQSEHALLYVDLDQFKIINDTCGHAAGDELLIQIGKLITAIVNDQDQVSRLGGDEFGILLVDYTLKEAVAMASRILEAIKKHRFIWNDNAFTVTTSIGVVQISGASISVEEVLSCADMACYAAKDKGRSYIQVYDLNDEDLSQRRAQMHWASRIRTALDQDSFVLYKQAITGLKQPIVNYEFLVRMQDEGSLIAPGLFIPAAERFNLMTLIDKWVINHAFGYVKACINNGTVIDGLYFINLSGSSLNDPLAYEYIKEQVIHHGLPANKFCFEITETTAISNIETASVFIAETRELGFRFALDDFGVGMSSFAYLKGIPVDILKIDGGFIRNIANDPMDLAIVDACNSIAHSAGLLTVAEFVENSEIEHILRALGVDFAQGYGIEKPKPLNE